MLVKSHWATAMDLELCDFLTWKTFSASLRRENLNRFWVAIDDTSGDVIGTIGLVAFRQNANFSMMRGCGWDCNWTLEFDHGRIDEEQLILEIKV